MTRQQVFSFVFFALLALLLYQMALMLQPFVFPVLWAGLLAHWAFPLHLQLSKLFKGNDAVSAAVLTAGALGMVVVPLAVIAVLLVDEAGAAEQTIRAWIAAGGLHRLPDQLATIPFIGGWLRTAVAGIDLAHRLGRTGHPVGLVVGHRERIDGGTVRLSRLIGHSHALDLILTGRGVSGDEAVRMGLVNRSVPTGTALEAALQLAHELAALPQRCLRSDRLSSYEQWGLGLDAALANETARGLDTILSGETVAGASRFAAGAGRHGASDHRL